jgi:hypothetical protein
MSEESDTNLENLRGRKVRRMSDNKMGTIKYYWGGNKFMIQFGGGVAYLLHRSKFKFLKNQ